MDAYLSQFERTYYQLTGSGKAPWMQEGPVERGPAYNPYSGVLYRGINGVMLDMTAAVRDFRDPRWISLNEAARLGLTLRYGEQPAPVAYTRPASARNSYYLMCNLEQFKEFPKMPARDILREQKIGKENLRAALEESGASGFQGVVDKVEEETARDGDSLTRALARYRLAQECHEYYRPPVSAEQMRIEAGIGKERLFLIRAVRRAETIKGRLISRAGGGMDKPEAVIKEPGRETYSKASFEAFSN